MTRTLTALYDTRAQAEHACRRLIDLGIPPGSINLIDRNPEAGPGADGTGMAPDGTPEAAAPPTGATSPPIASPLTAGAAVPPTDPAVRPDSATAAPASAEHGGFWAKLRHLFPERERHAYEEGVHRGGTLLTASVNDDMCDRAITALEDTQPVDLQQREAQWREAGWTAGHPAAVDEAPASTARAPLPASEARIGDGQEQVIPVAEENLRVGKRETSRGSVRVHSYLVEEPVQENVRLREDRVEVQRRPASGASTAASDALKERTVEMRETAEEPVIEKEPRVKEEVVVRKRAGEHVEQVRDTVRRTEVDIERSPGTGRPTEAERTPRRPEDRPGH